VLSVLAIVVVLYAWTAEAWHDHADHRDHHDCPICQVALHTGSALVAPVVPTVCAPIGVAWSPVLHATVPRVEEPYGSVPSPRGPPSSSLI